MRSALWLPLLALLTGCDLAGPDYGPDVAGVSYRGVSVDVAALVVARGDTVAAAIVNGSTGLYGTGPCYLVERWHDGGWVRRADDNGPCTLPLFVLESGAEFAKPFVAHVAPGTIRLVELMDEEERVLIASPSIRVTR